MIKFIVYSLLSTMFMGCGVKEKYSPVVEYVQDKTVMISVPTVVLKEIYTFDQKGLKIDQSTVTVNIGGSGVIISDTGLVLSCEHLFDREMAGPIIMILSNGTTVPAKLLSVDAEKDLALLKIPGVYKAASFGFAPLRLGQEVIAVGNPLYQSFTTTHGIISHLNRDINEAYLFTQIDAPINGGNSGGPLFDLQGRLIGINARKWPNADGLGLAIAPSTIHEFLSDFRGL